MKRHILPLLLALALLLCGCSRVYTAEHNGTIFTVDTENQTIAQDSTIYQFEIDDWGSSTRYIITYPDGATYTAIYSDTGSTSGTNSLYKETPRLGGDILVGILRDNQPKQKEPAQYLLCLLLIGLGIFYVAAPYAVWYLLRGWYYHGAEPSNLSLTAARIGGVGFIIFGIILIFI